MPSIAFKRRVFFQLVLGIIFSSQLAASETIDIGTGGITGVYYPTGVAICRLINKQVDAGEISTQCAAQATSGSVYNLNAMSTRDLDFAIAQSDWQYHAYYGTSIFSVRGADKALRAVFSLHNEPFTVVARQDAKITEFNQLKNKRLNVGNPGSGHRSTLEVLMRVKGMTMQDFKSAAELNPTEQALAICDNKIDAFVYAVGHPSASITQAATFCDVNVVHVRGRSVERLIEQTPYYAKAIIPKDMYPGTMHAIETFGVKATLVTHADVDEAIVYRAVKAVFENLDEFKAFHPAFATLEPAQMLEGNTMPFHKGALRYYQEQGWLDSEKR